MHVGLMRLYAFSEHGTKPWPNTNGSWKPIRELDAYVSSTTERLREEIAAGTFPPAQPPLCQQRNRPIRASTTAGLED